MNTQETPFVERDCIIEHNGLKFELGGAIVTDSRLIAYPAENGILKDWHGNQIGTWQEICSRRAVFFGRRSWIGDTYHFMRAYVNGKTYSLRGFGVGMIASGKALKQLT